MCKHVWVCSSVQGYPLAKANEMWHSAMHLVLSSTIHGGTKMCVCVQYLLNCGQDPGGLLLDSQGWDLPDVINQFRVRWISRTEASGACWECFPKAVSISWRGFVFALFLVWVLPAECDQSCLIQRKKRTNTPWTKLKRDFWIAVTTSHPHTNKTSYNPVVLQILT